MPASLSNAANLAPGASGHGLIFRADYPMSVSYSWSSGVSSSAYTISLSGANMVGGAS